MLSKFHRSLLAIHYNKKLESQQRRSTSVQKMPISLKLKKLLELILQSWLNDPNPRMFNQRQLFLSLRQEIKWLWRRKNLGA